MFSKVTNLYTKNTSASVRYCLSARLKCNQLARCVMNDNTALVYTSKNYPDKSVIVNSI